MTINKIIEEKYDELYSYCNINIIKRCEINSGWLNDIEDVDLLHTLLIRLLKKYKKTNFVDLESGYLILKNEVFRELKYFSKMKKPNTLYFEQLTLKAINDESTEFD